MSGGGGGGGGGDWEVKISNYHLLKVLPSMLSISVVPISITKLSD